MNKYYGFLVVCCLSALMACRKKELPEPVLPLQTKGNMKVRLNNVVGDKPLILGDSVTYSVFGKGEYSVSVYNYYLSNFIFTDNEGNRYTEPESYHLAVTSKPESLSFDLKNVPFGAYTSVEFLIGVDSVRNFSGVQEGALDPIHGMIWSWSTGYIMAKMEGKIKATGNLISYHIAGYKGEYNTLQKVKLNLPENAVVSAGKTPVITLQSDLHDWFNDFTFPGFEKLPSIGVEGPNAHQMAQNYSTMMSVVKVEQE